MSETRPTIDDPIRRASYYVVVALDEFLVSWLAFRCGRQDEPGRSARENASAKSAAYLANAIEAAIASHVARTPL
jgi:hypothetical protein